MPPPPLPPGVNPIDVARAGRWLLGRCAQAKAKLRRASVPTRSPRCLADEFVQLMWPWEVWEYPGKRRGLGALLQIAPSYARNLMQGRQRLPMHQARRLVSYLEGRIAREEALLAQLRDEIVREERERAMFPHPGYTNGIARWRREQAALKAAAEAAKR